MQDTLLSNSALTPLCCVVASVVVSCCFLHAHPHTSTQQQQQQHLLLQAKTAGWGMEGGSSDVIVLPANAHNTPVQKRTQDLIGFQAVAPILRYTATTV